MSHQNSVRAKVIDAFRHFKVGAGKVLPQNSIDYHLRQQLTPPEERVLDEVVADMISEGLMSPHEGPLGGWQLTKEGEALVYPA